MNIIERLTNYHSFKLKVITTFNSGIRIIPVRATVIELEDFAKYEYATIISNKSIDEVDLSDFSADYCKGPLFIIMCEYMRNRHDPIALEYIVAFTEEDDALLFRLMLE